MSALLRGIVLGLDANRLIVEAKPEDVRRYTVGEAVAVLAEQGWEVRLSRSAEAAFRYNVSRGERYVGAVLRTACGCEKRIPMAYPAQATYRVPISKAVAGTIVGHEQDAWQVQVGVREFRHSDILQDEHGNALFVYKEQL